MTFLLNFINFRGTPFPSRALLCYDDINLWDILFRSISCGAFELLRMERWHETQKAEDQI